MEIGVVGKPNVGKSTFFAAATLAPAEIADYPFTTIKPNRGMAYVRVPCPHVELKLPKCDPRNAPCKEGVRFVPVELLDVAGLVPKAHEGRGLGNRFLDDLRQASVLLHVVDASGSTNEEGVAVPPGSHDPQKDVAFLEEELFHWIKGLLERDWENLQRKWMAPNVKPEEVLHDKLAGLGLKEIEIKHVVHSTPLDPESLARKLRETSKPILVLANKVDKADASLVKTLVDGGAIPVAAVSELALRKASEAGVVRYKPGDQDFALLKPEALNDKQKAGLEYVRSHVLAKFGTTGVQQALERAVFGTLQLIAVFPVEDETHFKDKEGRVLPDAHLLKAGSTAKDLAAKVHTDLAKNFIRAIDARAHRVIGADHELKTGDVIKIVAAR